MIKFPPASSYPIPPIAENMRPVSKEEFYAAMNCNVHPTIPGRHDQYTAYISEWRLQDGSRKLIGVSDGGTVWCPARYWLP